MHKTFTEETRMKVTGFCAVMFVTAALLSFVLFLLVQTYSSANKNSNSNSNSTKDGDPDFNFNLFVRAELNRLKDEVEDLREQSVKGEREIRVGPGESAGLAGKQEMHQISLPIGFVYIQLPNQQAPAQLWPDFSWKSISSEYAGLFFRAEGGGSSPFGQMQNDRTNRITQIALEYLDCFDDNYKLPSPLVLPESGWSQVGRAGWYIRGRSTDEYNCEGIKVESSGGETRPRNTAIRIWKRIA